MSRAERRREARETANLKPTEPKGDRVAIGYVHPGEYRASFAESLMDLQMFELARSAVENNGAGYPLERIAKGAGAGGVAYARNMVTAEFLAGPSDWLLFIDTDMGFPNWAVARLLGVARHDGFKPIVAGLCFALSRTGYDPETKAETYESFPTIGFWNRNEQGEILGYRHMMQYDRDAVLKIDQTGAAFVMIHRTVFEQIGVDGWWTPLPVPQDAEIKGGGDMFSEDVSFFIRVADAGIDVWLDTMTRTSHDKRGVFLTQELFDLQWALKDAAGQIGVPSPPEKAR